MIRIAVIGYGYWGPNLARNFAESKRFELAAVSDLSPDRLELAARRYPGITSTADCREVMNDPSIDAVAISTPVSSHYDIALQALEAGKHVLVEKPLTSSAEQALRLTDEAERRGRILMVDHTFVYTGAVRKIHELINNGSLGTAYYYDSVRVNLGLFQRDVDVLWDLAVHDLSIMNYVLAERPCAVSATGLGHVPGRKENIAYLTLFFDSNTIGHIHVNWLSPVKVRRTLVGCSKRMIVYDDLETSEKIKIYDRGIDITDDPEKVYEMLVSYRTGDMYSPKLDITEALAVEAEHFADCIEQQRRPITDGQAGFDVVSVLEAATQSMRDRGRPVELGKGMKVSA